MFRASLCLSIVAAVAASLPQTPPERIFGSWFFMSAGVKVQPVPASAPIPHWLPSSVTVASFAFISPEELDTMGDHALPQAFRTRVAEFLSAGVRVSFSIGGESFANDWTFLASACSLASFAARALCAASRRASVWHHAGGMWRDHLEEASQEETS